ncbi:hypothetical protein G9272_39535 [Streptomyces asoensis]|uniref:Uncharacterized protein n=1 Tax=Streptomyces asoensis TaxID=249586 RepID=A0A6M4WYL4_9ACTN|nr:hypothetical protein [Streptomyces asoensis]QJT05667.1 hypothetical protein G9272_39535 [Streptomyces asoensis]
MPGLDGGAGCVRAAQGLDGRPEQGVQGEIGLDKADRELVLTAALEWDGGSAGRRGQGAPRRARNLPSRPGPDRKRWPHPSSSALAWRIMAV